MLTTVWHMAKIPLTRGRSGLGQALDSRLNRFWRCTTLEWVQWAAFVEGQIVCHL